jgi:RNA polymerase sigma-70 factor, ECF subfamily
MGENDDGRHGADADVAVLVGRVRGGSRSAGEELYAGHVRLVRFVVADNVRDPDEIDDVVQEVFARAFTRLDTLNDPLRFRSWLLQIARRAAIDARRIRRRRPEFAPVDQHELVDGGPAPDLVVEVRELAAAVAEGLAGLSSRDALVLTMVVELGFGLEDVAAALDVSYGTAKVVLHRARRRLRAAVAGIIEDPEPVRVAG